MNQTRIEDLAARLRSASDTAYGDCMPYYGDILNEAANAYDEAQAKIDALMLEYCPEDMTPEQIENWKRHQVGAHDILK